MRASSSCIITWNASPHVSQPCFAEPSPILEFERAISGRVLVDARLFDAPPDSQHLVPLGNSPTSAAEIAIRLSGSRPPLPVPELYELVDASVFLRGIDFPLCNPLYPTENRISFVFATLNGCHELSDRVVAVHDRAVCETIGDDVMRGADWFLTRPSIHLRKFGERWIDLFLGTVKCCVMPDLRWWHYEYEPGYTELSRNLAQQRRDTFRGDETLAAEAAFVAVQNALHAELVSWGALGSD